MSQLFRLIKCNQLIRARSSLFGIKLIQPQAPFWMPYNQIKFSSTSSNSGPKQEASRVKDDIKYVVKFKNIDVKKIFKQFYSLYGPLFVVCHIGVSLTSLGFWSGLVWLVVDPMQYMPESIIVRVGEKAASYTNDGGKFVIAYGIHKISLPFRLAASIYLTRFLAPKIKFFKK